MKLAITTSISFSLHVNAYLFDQNQLSLLLGKANTKILSFDILIQTSISFNTDKIMVHQSTREDRHNFHCQPIKIYRQEFQKLVPQLSQLISSLICSAVSQCELSFVNFNNRGLFLSYWTFMKFRKYFIQAQEQLHYSDIKSEA